MAPAPKFTTAQAYDPEYEQDARHVDVDIYTTSHLLTAKGNKHHDSLERIYENSLAAGLPDIACSPSQAKFLMIQVQMANAKNILEVGTLGGYSAAWMATANPDVQVTTIEINEGIAAVASKNLAEAGLSSQVEIRTGAALDLLPTLVSQVQAGERPPFDFVFIDANKEDNLAYFNLSLSMSRARAVIVVDNVVRNGKVASLAEAGKDDRVMGARRLIEAVGRNDLVDATVIQTVGEKNYDGFLMAIKK
jgi:predicted O-methyltransferase YrrM